MVRTLQAVEQRDIDTILSNLNLIKQCIDQMTATLLRMSENW